MSSPLDEFAVEGRKRSPEPEPAIDASALLEFAPAKAPHEGGQEPFSRIEAREAVRRRRRSSPGRRVTAVARRLALRIQKRAFARRSSEHALEHQEFNGFVVAVALAVAVLGYGLAIILRTPTDVQVVRVTAPQPMEAVPVMTALAVPVAENRSLVQAVNRPAAVRTVSTDVERRTPFMPTARTLTALWQRRDTRSLDRAFATLRRDTLAFRRCGMRLTDGDRAVARCEGLVTTLAADGAPRSRFATWTIDFQRTSGRWQIARVSTR